jgi:hypothetical protein
LFISVYLILALLFHVFISAIGQGFGGLWLANIQLDFSVSSLWQSWFLSQCPFLAKSGFQK